MPPIAETREDPTNRPPHLGKSSIPPQFAGCGICRTLRGYFENGGSSGSINCGPIEDARNTECLSHGPLLNSFYDYCNINSRLNDSPDDVGFLASGRGTSVQIVQSISKLGLFWNLSLVHNENIPDHPGIGRILDDDWIDLDVIKLWKEECLVRHGSECENPIKIWPARPAWLIDVHQGCIVPGNNITDYVALSYRWGDGLETRTHIEQLEKLQVPHSLKDGALLVKLAPIVHHAIYLTEKLGERFVWIDSLCIPHGDHKMLAEQLDLMGAIYANAIVTIVATDDDAHVGIQGLKGVSGSRQLSQNVFAFGEDRIAVRRTGIFSLSTGGEYHERGWTYQEFMMSKRKLIFKNKEVHWECSCCVWHEDLTLGTEIDKYINPRLSLLMAGIPEMSSLHHCITNYNIRKLKFDEDALAGFSGLLAICSRSFTGGFLYGLPEMDFESNLCWRPYWDYTELRRRVPSNDPQKENEFSLALPSWSWVGWEGMVGWDYEALRVNTRMSWFTETFPITDWYTWDAKENKALRRIASTWSKAREEYKKASEPLPAGWSRHAPSEVERFRDEPILWPDNCGEHVYKHAAVTDEDCPFWFFPFPIANIDSTVQPSMPEQIAHLFCKTKRGFVGGFREVSDQGNEVKLTDSTDKVIGTLRVHNQDQLSEFRQRENVPDILQHDAIELVAISWSRKYSKNFDKEKMCYATINKPRDVVNVLWIEWINGIAYRLAAGTVHKLDWEALELQDVDLILG
ncbi:uncharacterized protein PV09_05092 [Verruconis gallopava]|uniref:Heterokaryon incompatibility domain-containing protein n=1 Tax=Verruconis gallopava TaxID=253628 RepID=A0A0D2AX69_9PEZI|nr:uncharacterized protein PV09_05092 [Verruconis gallopava]KIW03789.1 hypothetical protein PV09_05092 [Verruconis gallopava]